MTIEKWILTTENLKGSIKTQDHLIIKIIMAKNSNGIAISSFSKTEMHLPLFWLFTWFIKYRRINVSKSHWKCGVIPILLLSITQEGLLKREERFIIRAKQSVLDEKNFKCVQNAAETPLGLCTAPRRVDTDRY